MNAKPKEVIDAENLATEIRNRLLADAFGDKVGQALVLDLLDEAGTDDASKVAQIGHSIATQIAVRIQDELSICAELSAMHIVFLRLMNIYQMAGYPRLQAASSLMAEMDLHLDLSEAEDVADQLGAERAALHLRDRFSELVAQLEAKGVAHVLD